MENLDFSKLRRFDTLAIHKQLDEYIKMLYSDDIESKLLAIGLLRENREIINYLQVLLRKEAEAFIWYLDQILDEATNNNIQHLFLYRVTLTLNKIRRGFNNFHYSINGTKK